MMLGLTEVREKEGRTLYAGDGSKMHSSRHCGHDLLLSNHRYKQE